MGIYLVIWVFFYLIIKSCCHGMTFQSTVYSKYFLSKLFLITQYWWGLFFVKGSPLSRISPDICHINISWCALDTVRYEKNILSEQKHLVSNKNGLFKQQLSKQMWLLLLSFWHLTLKSGPMYLDYYLFNAKNVMLSKYKCYLFRRTSILKAISQNMVTHLFPLPLSISLPLNFPWWFLTC